MKKTDIRALKRAGTILIVDDEPLVRRGLAAILQELFGDGPGPVVREAEDGVRAVEILRHEPAGLVFTDIKMPNMDGIALLGWIGANCPDCQTVVLSCHDDYDFVRRAFQHKVLDYILKYDIDREGVELILRKVLEAGERREQARTALAAGSTDGQAAYTRWLADAGPDLPEQAWYRLIAVVVHSRPSRNPVAEQAVLRILEAAARRLKLDDTLFQLRSISPGCLLVLHASPSEVSRGTAASLCQGIRPGLEAAAGEQVSLLVSEQRRWASSLADLYRPLLPLLRRSFFAGPGIYFREEFDQAYRPPGREELLPEFKVEAYALLAEGSLPTLRSRLLELGSEIAGNPDLDIDTVKTFYRELADLTAVCRRDVLQGESERAALKASREAIDHAGSYGELEKIMRDLLQTFSGRGAGEGFSIGIRRALSCIHANFEKKSFSLTDVAEQLNYSHSYLSRQFKKELEVNIVTYINNLRLAEAKRLLGTGRYLVYEIAARVGFNNYNYFSRMYKKRYGVSPSGEDR